MNWMDVPFIDYLNAVDDVLETRYGVTSNGTGLEHIAASQEAGETPEECAEALAEKYRLERLPEGGRHDKNDIPPWLPAPGGSTTAGTDISGADATRCGRTGGTEAGLGRQDRTM